MIFLWLFEGKKEHFNVNPVEIAATTGTVGFPCLFLPLDVISLILTAGENGFLV